MPLHTIPLCNFSYVGDILSGAVFEYDVREKIAKNKNKLFYKENLVEIDKVQSKMVYKEITDISKNNTIMLYRKENNIDKNNHKLLYKENIKVEKMDSKYLYNQGREMNIIEDYNLGIDDINIVKEVNKNLNGNDVKFNKNKTYEMQDINVNELTKNNAINLNVDKNLGLTKNNTFQFSSNILEFVKVKDFILDKVFKYREILKENEAAELDRISTSNINKTNFYNLFKELEELNYSINPKLFYRNKINLIDKSGNNIFIDKETIKSIDKSLNNLLLYKNKTVPINLDNPLFLYKVQNKEIFKEIFNKLIYKNYNKIFKNKVNKELNNVTIANILKDNTSKLMYINNIRDVYLGNPEKLIYKDVTKDIYKDGQKYFSKDIIKDLFKSNLLELIKHADVNIFKNNLKFIKNINYRNIYKDNLLGLNKTEIDIFNRIDLYGLNKSSVDITKNIYNITDLEVIKRWWALRATSPYDQKILPVDYNYLKKPLFVNRRDREYGYLIDQDKHPISNMSYLEDNMGIDLDYGLEEINLSIEIMLDMINIVGMIIQHGASQFANCSGQEAMEFIMEVLLDWLNMDSTIHEMQLKGSREHYLRCYRWIRWEAEKVWFTADEDHTQDKMMGIKYAGMLFANLLDYMKYHHFNVVPLWRNLKYMDIERQFNRVATNGDIMQELDKLKSKRHYLIETQNFERKNILGGR